VTQDASTAFPTVSDGQDPPDLRFRSRTLPYATKSLALDRIARQDQIVVTRHTRPHVQPTPLDEISKRIIEQLQEDGRRPYAAIGKAVGLSEAAVRQRVQRLLDAGVMQIVAVTDPLQVGFSRQAMIGLQVEGDLNIAADLLTDLPEVDYVVVTAGSFDLLVEVVCEDDDHLLELLSQRIRTLPGVRSAEVFVYLKLRKQLYNWGTR
jgi:Lrp/AsnC family transcriptional regulator for asnA, asnC and gidA